MSDAGTNGGKAKAIVRHLPFPSDSGDTTIEVFHQKGNPAFVCGAHGAITGGMIEEIEKDFADNIDEGFERGDGMYLYVPRWETPQYGPEGRVELPGYWDLKEVGFKPMESLISHELRGGEAVRSDDLLAFYESVAPFLRRLREPRFDSEETNDYVCGSTDCKNALDALDAIEANAGGERPMKPQEGRSE